jgi:hypothetical protein
MGDHHMVWGLADHDGLQQADAPSNSPRRFATHLLVHVIVHILEHDSATPSSAGRLCTACMCFPAHRLFGAGRSTRSVCSINRALHTLLLILLSDTVRLWKLLVEWNCVFYNSG